MSLTVTQNIFLIGPLGAGKTTIGRALAKELKLDFYDTDQEIERRSGADIAWIFDLEGEAGYRQREHAVLEELSQKKGIVLATGGGIVAQAENRPILAACGIVLYLQATLEQQIKRTAKGRNRPLLQTKDPQAVLKKLHQQREPYYEELADLTFATGSRSIRAVVEEIVDVLRAMNTNVDDELGVDDF